MKTSATFSILFWINNSRLKDNKSVIFARITVNQKRVNFSLKRRVDKDSWNKYKSRVKPNCPNAALINRYINQVQNQLFVCYQDLKAENKLITPQSIKARYFGEDQNHKSLNELMAYHNEVMVNKLNKDTMRHYFTSQRYLKNFVLKQYKTQDIFLKDLNYAFVINFESYLRAYKPTDHHKKIGNNTVMRHIQRLRKMVTMAYHMEWILRDPFVKFKPTFINKEREFLSEMELSKIEAFSSPIKSMNFVKDIFVFSCYTGISYIDIMQLTKDNILKGIDGNLWIITKRQKTKTQVKIPILEQAQKLIDKYSDDIKALDKGTLFPVMSNQKINAYLKLIANLCQIEKNLTFHMARHTFATTVTLTNGVPIETVSKLLGHKKLATTQIYAHVIESKVSQDMAALRAVLDNKQNNLQKHSKQAH